MSERAEQRIGVATFRSTDRPARSTVVRGGAMTSPPTQREIRIVARSMQNGVRIGMKRGLALGFLVGVLLGALVTLFIVAIHRGTP
jgi:hypothetical protein